MRVGLGKPLLLFSSTLKSAEGERSMKMLSRNPKRGENFKEEERDEKVTLKVAVLHPGSLYIVIHLALSPLEGGEGEGGAVLVGHKS